MNQNLPRTTAPPRPRRSGTTSETWAARLGLLAAFAVGSSGGPHLARATTIETDAVLIDGRLGPSFLLDSRSNALEHLFKPSARLGGRLELGGGFELGASLLGLLSPNHHYRVIGLLGHGRYGLWQRPSFSLGVGAGLGVGKDADIQNVDLRADHTVMPYGFAALDARWSLGRSWRLGVELAYENLSLVSLGLTVGRRLSLGDES